jgi:hypothetical protein
METILLWIRPHGMNLQAIRMAVHAGPMLLWGSSDAVLRFDTRFL